VHTVGCRKWFNVIRDTATYRIAAVYRLDDPRPDLSTSRLPGGET
jgi:sarcosine oxidase subunit delta